MAEAPAYDERVRMAESRGRLAVQFAAQIIETLRPWVAKPAEDWVVLDLGCGYGHTALELARRCRRVVGVEPTTALVESARALAMGQSNLSIRAGGVEDVTDRAAFDVVVLDNVFEHLPDQPRALRVIADCLVPGGAAFVLMPNKLWPIEVHYGLPFLSYLPLPWANWYLRVTGRGTDYTDASYAVTYWGFERLVARHPELEARFVLPAIQSATMAGTPWHYRLGMALLARFPALWAISKAFLVVLRKSTTPTASR